MSGSYRRVAIALGIGLLAASSALAQAPVREQDKQGQASTQQAPASYTMPPIRVEVVEDQAEAEARKRREKEADQREVDDLSAQQGMNNATQMMADYALLQTILIAVGTCLLFYTLYLTRQANMAAVRAAKASENAVAVTQQVGQAQVRAYLSCEGAAYEVSKDWFSCNVKLRNHGQSPAVRCEVEGYVCCINFGISADRGVSGQRTRSEDFQTEGPSIPAGGIGDVLLIWDHVAMGTDAHEAIFSRGKGFYVVCKFEWTDVFGERASQVTHFNIVRDQPSFLGMKDVIRGELTAYNAGKSDYEYGGEFRENS